MKLQDYFELVEYKIGEGSKYMWRCFGDNAYQITSGHYEEYEICATYDTEDQTVFVLEAHDLVNNRSYRFFNETYKDAYFKECEIRGIEDAAYDDVKYVDLDLYSDFAEKAHAIIHGFDYDTRVLMNINIPSDELLQMMKAAHLLDVTFNEFVEIALKEAIENMKDKDGLAD
jgi:hypothetical protein